MKIAVDRDVLVYAINAMKTKTKINPFGTFVTVDGEAIGMAEFKLRQALQVSMRPSVPVDPLSPRRTRMSRDLTDEHREKISVSMKNAWAKRKEKAKS